MADPVPVRAAFGSGSFSNQCNVSIDLTGIDTLLVWGWSNGNTSLTTPISAVVDPTGANTAMTAGTNRDGNSVMDSHGNLRGFAVSGLALTGTKVVRVNFSDGDSNSVAWVAGYSGGTAVSASVQNTATSGSVSSGAISSETGSLVAGFFSQYGSDDTSTWTPTSPAVLDYHVLAADVAYWRGVVWSQPGAASVTIAGTVSPGFHWASEVWSITGTAPAGPVLTGSATLDDATSSGSITSAAPSTLSGSATLDDATSSGSITSAAPSTLSGSATLDDVTASGGITSAPVVGTFTSESLRWNNDTVEASVALTWLSFRNITTGAVVLSKTGVSTNSLGVFSVADALLVPGTAVRADWKTATGHHGWGIATPV